MRFLNSVVVEMPHRRLAKDGPLHPSLKRGGKEDPEGTLQSPPWTSFSCSSPRHAGPPSKPRTHLESKSPISAPNFPSIPFLTGCKLLLLERDVGFLFWLLFLGLGLGSLIVFFFGFLSESKKNAQLTVFAKIWQELKNSKSEFGDYCCTINLREWGRGAARPPRFIRRIWCCKSDFAKKKWNSLSGHERCNVFAQLTTLISPNLITPCGH